jgi:hypothetical protein
MMPRKCNDEQYIPFLLASPDHCSATEASQCHPASTVRVAHEAYTRLLHELKPQPEPLGTEVQPFISLKTGVLVIDDTMLDKP